MSGMEHLLKSMLGIDPEEIRKTALAVAQSVTDIHARLAAIEAALTRIEARQNCQPVQPEELPCQKPM